MRYFISWLSSSSSLSSSPGLRSRCVRSVLLGGSADLDWEVKVYTLELAQLILDQAFSAHRSYGKNSGTHPALSRPHGGALDQVLGPLAHAGACTENEEADLVAALNSVVELGVFSVLLGGLVDCDRPVALKACQLLVTLRETLCPLSGRPLETVTLDLPDRSWVREIRKILGAENQDVARTTRSADAGGHSDGTVSVCELLASLGLDERLDVLSQSSDHVHNSALSLLQDILTVGVTHTHPETQPGQEVIVDCY